MSVMPLTPGSQSTLEDTNDDLLHLLTDNWNSPLKETIKDARWIRDYLTRLTSLSLDALLHEPVELKEEQTKAIQDAQLLAFREYPSFLHAQTCRQQVEETIDGLDVHLGKFISSVPELEEACKVFEEHAKTIKEERNKITSVLEYQNVLTDLLEIPQLMETCVRNGYYSEAMNLASHVRLLQVRYPLPVIKSIQEQVQASSDLMLVQLISHLRKPIRLAAAMNMVGFLRRMDVFESETELRMVFLRCRHDCLQQRLTRIKRDISEDSRQKSVDAFEYVKKFVDVMREQMFEIGTQYVSIFSNEQSTILSDYMVHITQLIKSTLDTYLPMVEDTSSLASLLTQLQYCGMSLGRIGLDFRNIFVGLFERALQPMLMRWVDEATEELVDLITKATLDGTAPSAWMSSKTAVSNQNDQVQRRVFQPPMLLVGYPSLAIYTNGILSTFNALRLLPAISLFDTIQNHLEACFLDIGVALKKYCDYASKHIPDEITFLQSYTAAYVRCVLPYLKSCLVDGIYGNLSTPSIADEDMERLLEPYLPVMTKDIQEEDTITKPENEEKEQEDMVDATKEPNQDDSTNKGTNNAIQDEEINEEEATVTEDKEKEPSNHTVDKEIDTVSETNMEKEANTEEQAVEAEAAIENIEGVNDNDSITQYIIKKEPNTEKQAVETEAAIEDGEEINNHSTIQDSNEKVIDKEEQTVDKEEANDDSMIQETKESEELAKNDSNLEDTNENAELNSNKVDSTSEINSEKEIHADKDTKDSQDVANEVSLADTKQQSDSKKPSKKQSKKHKNKKGKR